MPMPKTLREHLEDGTLGPLRTRAQVEREEELLARIAELEAALGGVIQKFDAEILSEYEGTKMLKERLKEIDPARKILNP